MAGNDPGWGGRGGDGPPDLDEMMRNFSRKLNNLFGGSNRQGRPGPERNQLPGIPLLPVVGIVAVVWLASGFYIVDQGSRGLVLRFGKQVETTQPGPRWQLPYPIETVTVVNM
jgi:membrane protease subunit HflK